jgi:hypothetical protein
MTDDTNVEAGSETSGETAAVDTAQADTASTDTSATDTAQADTAASADAGDVATPKVGDSCKCPDGRAGTVHSYDTGLICIPNADQG